MRRTCVPFEHCKHMVTISFLQAFYNIIDKVHDKSDELHSRCSGFLQL